METTSAVASSVRVLRDSFNSGVTRPLEWRFAQLKAVEQLVKENTQELLEALHKDLRKPPFEAYCSEISRVLGVVKEFEDNLKTWARPEKVSGNLLVFPARCEIRPEPLGVALIITPWNYPCSLALEPMVGALAAGNTVLLKPSEVASATSAALARLVPAYLDSSCVRVIEGGPQVTTEILQQKFDKILYTGGSAVARIIATAAAQHLTPVTLELGGKNACYVDDGVDLDVVSIRLMSGRLFNNGQTCLCPDYVLAKESVADRLVDALKKSVKTMYGEDPQRSNDLARVINARHFQRLSSLLDHPETAKCVVSGGRRDASDNYIEPTILRDVPADAPIMAEEVFGPLLTVQTVKDVGDAIAFMNSKPKALCLYGFTNRKDVEERLITETSSGSVTINDTIIQFSVSTLPFGGVGESGMGAYHGKFTFDCFSHKKAVMRKGLGGDLPVRYPPHTARKQGIVSSILKGDMWGLVLYLLGLRKGQRLALSSSKTKDA